LKLNPHGDVFVRGVSGAFQSRGRPFMPAHFPSFQRGVSLLVVMVMVLLSSLLVLGSTRVAVLNESLAANDADYQRAFEAAQAMLVDAEADLRGAGPTGVPCAPPANCRPTGVAGQVFFPRDASELQDLEDLLRAAATGGAPPCRNGICLDLGNQVSGDRATSFWNDPGGTDADWNNNRNLATFTGLIGGGPERYGAVYGRYTGATYAAASGNPLLDPATPRAWYWVELLRYNPASAAVGGRAAFWQPGSVPLAYRITAVAQGRRPGSMAVVQSYVVMNPMRGL
jgi:Tfp pilus assembly protein PilX